MNKKILLLFLMACMNMFGQAYIPLLDNQNEWHFTNCYEGGCITDIYYTNGDTIVNNKSHKILDGFHYISRTFLLSENVEQKKVYLTKITANHIDEYLLYDFSLGEGATFEMKNPISPFPTEGGLFVLDSIRQLPFGESELRKHFYFSPHESNTISSQKAIWVEGVGSLSMINAPGGYPDINGVGLLNCFFKNGTLFYSNLTPEVTVCEPTILSNPKNIQLEIVVYFPENDKSVCYLKNTDEVNSVELFDLNGRKLAVFENHQQTEMRLDLNAFSKGMYLFKILFNRFEKHILFCIH